MEGRPPADARAVTVVDDPDVALGTPTPADRGHQRPRSGVRRAGGFPDGCGAGVYSPRYTCNPARERLRPRASGGMSCTIRGRRPRVKTSRRMPVEPGAQIRAPDSHVLALAHGRQVAT